MYGSVFTGCALCMYSTDIASGCLVNFCLLFVSFTLKIMMKFQLISLRTSVMVIVTIIFKMTTVIRILSIVFHVFKLLIGDVCSYFVFICPFIIIVRGIS